MVSILVSNDLLLRSWTAEDAPALFRTVDDDRPHLRPWLTWVDKTTKPEHSAAYIQQTLAMAAREEAVHLGIFHQQRVIGAAGLHDRNHLVGTAAVGYWISSGFEGRGIVAQCVGRLLNFAFDTLGLQKVELKYAASNARSATLARRMGFTREGMLRRGCWRDGRVEDLVVTGLLREEWPRQ